MAEDNSVPSKLPNLITEAREGRLGLRIEPEEFVYIDRDCQRFMDLIQRMQRAARDISDIDNAQWGIGADQGILTSARTLVGRFRQKAKGDGNSVHAVLEEHYKVVQDIQTLHREIRQRYEQEDSDFAARVNELLAQLPENPTPIDPKLSTPDKGQPEPLTSGATS
ncbi:hypothetical protein [Nocardia sp. NPDC005366]|uniref:hypothetical protein n=1 Tax=Nocardia sp. NPDC005366 TaxID=3156878 RepID=UPI0033AA49A0